MNIYAIMDLLFALEVARWCNG